jgi:4-hydroxythreonine-4-phosphate dehydrogenase
VVRPIQIAITTGDADGIGSEVTAKALSRLGPQKGVHFFLWRSPRCPKKDLARIDRKFKRIKVSTWPEALSVQIPNSKTIVDICSNQSPATWIELSAQACMHKHLQGMVTAPISKTLIQESGTKALGHTDILKRISGKQNIFMSFIGDHFNVVLASGHIPIRSIESRLNEEQLELAVRAADQLRAYLDKKKRNRPVAVVGLNPHAGEQGLIGNEEKEWITPCLERLHKAGLKVQTTPLVPDAAFFKSNWEKYSVYVALYHDQGLIPFKMIHGQDSGIQISMGLPFVRTSVDHGTAKNIFGKDRANPSSMLEALKWCIQLSKSSLDTEFAKG